MADRVSATPLLALDAVVLDTETTSLEPAHARVVELAGIRLVSGRIDQNAPFHVLIDPGEPIPAISTSIHGIDAARIKNAPGFIAAWQDFVSFLGKDPVVGHTTAYDLAVLSHECERAGVPFHVPRTIDVRILSEIVEPDLAGFSLEKLAAWLNVDIENRHSALGDALTTARIFSALVPHLRENGIRTFAEAETACRELSEAIAVHHRAGWVESKQATARIDTERTLTRLDTYPYRHRVREVMSAPPLVIAPTASIEMVLHLLAEKKVSSVFVAPQASDPDAGPYPAAKTGIVTERDMLRALHERGTAVVAAEVGSIASRPLASVPADDFVYSAIGRMDRLKIRHLGVVDETGLVIGALSARDLLRLRARDAVRLDDEIDEAKDVHELGRAWAKLPTVARGLLEEEIDARDIAAIVSRELGTLTRRAAILAENRMIEAGRGPVPVPYAVLVLGSAGRGESLLAMDQDNAIVFAEGDADGPEDRWFAALGTHLADLLHEVGIPYCKGGVMAKNAAFRGSAKLWRERIDDWINRSSPQDLLAVDIFFDFRAVHGDGALAESLWRDAYDLTKGQNGFVKLLAEAAGPIEPPIGFFGIRTENGRVDLKRGGLYGIVSTARVLAIRYHVVEHSTRARLEGVKALKAGAERDLDALMEAHGVLLAAVLDQQLVDIAAGRPPSNAVEPRRMSRAEQERLKQALRSLTYADEMVRDLLTGG